MNAQVFRDYDYGRFPAIVFAAQSVSSHELKESYRIIIKSFFELSLFEESIDFILKRVLESVQEDDFEVKEVYIFLARAHYYLGQHLQAIEYCRKALSLDSFDREPLWYIGLAFAQLGEAGKGREYLIEAIRDDTIHLYGSHTSLKELLSEETPGNSLIELFELARDEQYIIEEIIQRIFLVSFGTRRDSLFMERCATKLLTTKSPNVSTIQSFLAHMYFLMGAFRKAEGYANSSLSERLYEPFALLVKALLSLNKHRYTESISLLTLSIIHNPWTKEEFEEYDFFAPSIHFSPHCYIKECRSVLVQAHLGNRGIDSSDYDFQKWHPTYDDMLVLKDLLLLGQYDSEFLDHDRD